MNLALVSVSVVAGLALVEISLRLIFAGSQFPAALGPDSITAWRQHDLRGWSLQPNVIAVSPQFGANIPYRTNSQGFRDYEYEFKKSEHFRILVLGDSFMEAQQVWLEDSLTKRLEARWSDRQVQVLNLGVTGYGTIQEFLLLKDVGLAYQPDIVLLAFFAMNDVEDNSRPLSRIMFGSESILTFGRPYTSDTNTISDSNAVYPDADRVTAYLAAREAGTGGTRSFLQQSYLLRISEYAFAHVVENPTPEGHFLPRRDPNVLFGTMLTGYRDFGIRTAETYDHLWTNAWRVTLAHVEAIDRLTRENHARFIVFTVPERLQVDRDYRELALSEYQNLSLDIDKPQRILSQFCSESGITYIDLVPKFAEHDEKGLEPLYTIDRHWNERGHELAANVIADRLEADALIPESAH